MTKTAEYRTTVRGRVKGAAWGHIWHIDRAAATAGSILLSQGCIFQPQGSILLSQGCMFSTAREYIAESGVYIWQSVITAAQRNGKLFVLQWNGQFPPVLTIAYRRAVASTMEPPYSVLAQQPKRRTKLPGYSCSDSAYLVC